MLGESKIYGRRLFKLVACHKWHSILPSLWFHANDPIAFLVERSTCQRQFEIKFVFATVKKGVRFSSMAAGGRLNGCPWKFSVVPDANMEIPFMNF